MMWCKLRKTIISIRTVYHYAPPNYSSHQTFIVFMIANMKQLSQSPMRLYMKCVDIRCTLYMYNTLSEFRPCKMQQLMNIKIYTTKSKRIIIQCVLSDHGIVE